MLGGDLNIYFNKLKKSKLFTNFLSLSVLELVNYLIPIILVPYVIRLFGIDSFGKYMFAQAFSLYFNLIVDFGFNFYATKEISINREDKKYVSKIFTSVFIVKSILLFVSAIIFFIIINVFPNFEDKRLFMNSFVMVLGYFLFPIFLFQGLELMKSLTLINIIPKIIILGVIFLLVNEEKDFYLFVLLMSLMYVSSGILSLVYLFYNKIVFFKPVSRELIFKVYNSSKHLFVANSASVLYINSNSFILGLVSTFEFVGVYSVAEKIVRVSRYVVKPLSQALFPFYSKKFSNQSILDSKQDIVKLLKKLTPFLMLIILLLILFSKPIINFIGGEYDPRIHLSIGIMSVVILIGTYNNILGVLGFVNLGLEKKFKKYLIVVGVFNVFVVTVLGYLFNDLGAALTFMLSELFLFLLLYNKFRRI